MGIDRCEVVCEDAERFTRMRIDKSEGVDMIKVYPACAGIDLPQSSFFFRKCLPHADRPSCPADGVSRPSYPHARIDLPAGSYAVKTCLPRMRGDRPSVRMAEAAEDMFTPHARGSTP